MQVPVTLHQKQTFWQIWFPLAITIIGFLTLAILACLVSGRDASISAMWANISLIFLIVPVLFFGLLLLAILLGLIYLMAKVFSLAPIYLKKAQYYTNVASDYIHKWADQSVLPIVWIQAKSSQIKTFFTRIHVFTLKR